MSIKFGTDGWRAVISDTFTFNNLRLVAQAIADYVRNEGDNGPDPEVVIGFDTRFLSDRYATEVARVMAGNGIVAWLTRADAPTPAISYSVVEKKAAAGIMITASHNPPRYNGLKLKGRLRRRSLARSRHAGWSTIWKRPRPRPGVPTSWTTSALWSRDLIRRFDPVWAYYEHLGKLVDLDTISGGELRVVADAMYGSGRGCIAEMLSRTRCHVHEIRGEMNPGFGGIHPEPIGKYLNALVAAMQRPPRRRGPGHRWRCRSHRRHGLPWATLWIPITSLPWPCATSWRNGAGRAWWSRPCPRP